MSELTKLAEKMRAERCACGKMKTAEPCGCRHDKGVPGEKIASLPEVKRLRQKIALAPLAAAVPALARGAVAVAPRLLGAAKGLGGQMAGGAAMQAGMNALTLKSPAI